MKRVLIGTLVGVNVVLLLALMLGLGESKANAQIIGAQTDYLIITGAVGGDDAVYVIDLKRRGMIALGFDKQNKRIAAFRGARRLDVDFGRN